MRKANFLNLHAHSNFSDGNSTLEEMARVSKELNFTVCVVTDHLYSLPDIPRDPDSFNMGIDKYLAQLNEASLVEYKIGIPIVCGLEVSIAGYEEVVLIGKTAVIEVIKIRDENKKVTIDNLRRIREIHPCVINLCHPMNHIKFINSGGHEILDGYEYIHSGSLTYKSDDTDPYHDLGKIKVCNSDAHTCYLLSQCWNITEIPLRSEEDIIQYFKLKGPVRHHISTENRRYMKMAFEREID